MVSRLPIFVFSVLLTISCAYKLTPLENEFLQGSCGIDSRRYHTKVVNGDLRKFPWAASVNASGILTATVISQRHIVFFNPFQVEEDGQLRLLNHTAVPQGRCIGDNWFANEETIGLFEVDFFNGTGPKEISQIVVIDGCYSLDTYKPMIFELKEDLVFHRDQTPICLHAKQNEYEGGEDNIFTVFGLGPYGNALTSAKFEMVGCGRRHAETPVLCAQPVNKTKVLCQGDFGGGGFITTTNSRAVLLGIYAEGNMDCESSAENQPQPEFINMIQYVQKICDLFGICPEFEPATPPPTTTESTTTEEDVFVTPAGEGSSTTEETIVAERFEPMKLHNCSGEDRVQAVNKDYSGHVKNIHINIVLDDEEN